MRNRFQLAHKRLKWFALITCIVFSVVASSAVTQKSWGEIVIPTHKTPACQLTGTLAKLCVEPSPSLQPTPELNPQANPNNPQGKFWNAIATKINPSPVPGSYEYLVLREYGGIFATNNPQIQLPHQVAFTTATETKAFQNTLNLGRVNAGRNCYLQQPAAEAFNLARQTVRIPLKSGNGGSDCLRTFETTHRFWHKYSNNQTLQQIRQGKPKEIMRVVAPPGSSQHLWGLAIDLGRLNSQQNQVLNQNGWYQTVKGDKPHWTYLGMSQAQLIELGFKKQTVGRNIYWLTPL